MNWTSAMNWRMLSPLAIALVLGLCSALPLAAQDDARGAGRAENPSAAFEQREDEARGTVEISDAALAQWLINDHRMEIAISRWAEQTLEEQQAVSYAKRMVEDHRQMVVRLEQMVRDEDSPESDRDGDNPAGGVTIETPDVEIEVEVDRGDARDAARRAAEAARRTVDRAGDVVDRLGDRRTDRRTDRADRRADRAGDRRARRDQPDADPAEPQETRAERRRERRSNLRGDRDIAAADDRRSKQDDWLRIKDQLSDQKIRSARSNLERYTGHEQVEAFVAMQLVHHQAMLDTLAVFQQHASPELTELLEENSEKVHAHLQMAGKLMGRVARR